MPYNPLPGGLGIGGQVAMARPIGYTPVDLRVQPADVAGSIAQGFGLAQQIQNAPLQRQMMQQQLAAQERMAPIQEQMAQLQLQSGQQALVDAREQARMKSVATGALRIQGLPPEQQAEFLQQRIQQLDDLGVDSSDSRMALSRLEQDPVGFQDEIARAVDWGRQTGVLASPELPELTALQKDLMAAGIDPTSAEGQRIITEKYVKPQTQVMVGGAAEESAEAKEIGKFFGQQYGEIQKSGGDASKQLKDAITLERLGEKAFAGSLAGVKRQMAKVADALGIEVEGLTETEAYQALSNTLTANATGQLQGALSEKELDFIQQSVPQLTQSKAGRKLINDIIKAGAEEKKQRAKAARKYRSEVGRFDGGFEDWYSENYTPKGQDLFERAEEFLQPVEPAQPQPGAPPVPPPPPDINDLLNKYG